MKFCFTLLGLLEDLASPRLYRQESAYTSLGPTCGSRVGRTCKSRAGQSEVPPGFPFICESLNVV